MIRGRGTGLFMAASLTSMLCALLRYVLLARVLSPEQLGLAATLVLIQQALESFTDAGADRFIVQDARGDEPSTGAVAQTASVLRGVLVAFLLVVAGGIVWNFSSVPVLGAPLMILAFSPLLFGMMHLDVKRLQRHGDFRPEGLAVIISEAGSLVAIIAALMILGDFRAVLVGLVARSLLLAVVSHLVAERRFALGAEAAHVRRLWAFAWPLLINGVVLFVGAQGDRMLIGAQVGLEALGIYSAAILLIFYPTQVLRKFMTTIKMPLIAGAPAGDARRHIYDRFGGETLILAVGMLVGFTLVGGMAILILYGEEYLLPLTTLSLIAILQSLRYLRVWPIVAALAMGRSRTVLIGNIWRMAGVPLAFLAGSAGWGLHGIIVAFTVGEAVAFAVVSLSLNPRLGFRRFHDGDRLGLFVVVGMGAFLFATAIDTPGRNGLTALFIAMALCVALIAYREAPVLAYWRRESTRLLQRLRRGVAG